MSGTPPTTSNVLCWPNRLLSADDLRRHLTSQRELQLLPKTIVTPLAADELRAKGVRISWQVPTAKDATPAKQGTWIYAQEKRDALVVAAIQALEREGLVLTTLDFTSARKIAEVVLAQHQGGLVFCGDPATLCCIANKIAGVRAASVVNVAQALRAKKNVAANLVAIEMPGRTLFEIRQIVKTFVLGAARCPDEVANTLKELDGHAHR
jgi:hypothetical protein